MKLTIKQSFVAMAICTFFIVLRTLPWLYFYNILDVMALAIGGRVYPVRHYPVAIRLRDRKGRAILCVALTPRSGDSSGATLGVRSVALLHAKCRPYYRSLAIILQIRLIPSLIHYPSLCFQASLNE